jgi:predicted nucleic acid-binding protein
MSVIIQLETDAKLHVQDMIRRREIELAWSFMLDYENDRNPFAEVRKRISQWKYNATVDCGMSDNILNKAKDHMKLGLREKDAVHLACAIQTNADYFLTTDKKILNKRMKEIKLINPIDFLRGYFNA